MRPWWGAGVTNHQKQLTSESVALLTGICSSRGGQTRSGGGSSYVIKHFSTQQEIPSLTKNSAVLGSSDTHPDLVSYFEEARLREIVDLIIRDKETTNDVNYLYLASCACSMPNTVLTAEIEQSLKSTIAAPADLTP